MKVGEEKAAPFVELHLKVKIGSPAAPEIFHLQAAVTITGDSV